MKGHFLLPTLIALARSNYSDFNYLIANCLVASSELNPNKTSSDHDRLVTLEGYIPYYISSLYMTNFLGSGRFQDSTERINMVSGHGSW